MIKNKKMIWGALGLGLLFVGLNKDKETTSKALGAVTKKNPKKKNVSLRYVQAQSRANETGKKQYLKIGDRTLSVSPTVRK